MDLRLQGEVSTVEFKSRVEEGEQKERLKNNLESGPWKPLRKKIPVRRNSDKVKCQKRETENRPLDWGIKILMFCN